MKKQPTQIEAARTITRATVVNVTKASVRAEIGLKRLPLRFRLYVAGPWLYDVLKANELTGQHHLWHQTYWVTYRSLDAKRATLTWRAEK